MFIVTIIIIIIMIFILINKVNVLQKENISCLNTRFGCCNDKYSPKQDIHGSNCRGF